MDTCAKLDPFVMNFLLFVESVVLALCRPLGDQTLKLNTQSVAAKEMWQFFF